MPLAANPFIVLSYVGGPAVLTNASSLLILSTSNRFARAVDRSRYLAKTLADGTTGTDKYLYTGELTDVGKRLALIGRAMASFYLALATFGLATLASIAGAVLAEAVQNPVVVVVMGAAVVAGLVGFVAFVTGAAALVVESRVAIRSLARESAAAVSAIESRA